MFQKARITETRLRLALYGPSKSGKTFTSLQIASAFGKVAVLDTEHGSAAKYARHFDFDVKSISNFHPRIYINAIQAAEKAGYDVIILDSLTHAWEGKGGVLEIKDKAEKKFNGNSWAAWSEATPWQQKLVDNIVQSGIHVIGTMRSKTEWVVTDGKPEKVGTQPVQRDGMEYEFDIVGRMDLDHNLVIEGSRFPHLDSTVIPQPGEAFATDLADWLTKQNEEVEETPDEKTPETGSNGSFVPDEEVAAATKADADLPFEDETEEPGKYDRGTYGKFHAVGTRAYGDDWDAKRAELTKAVSGGRAESSKDLTEKELNALISGIEKKIEENETMIG